MTESSANDGQKPPKIEFPCPNYPIKVLGVAGGEFHETVLEIMEIHAPGFDRTTVRIQSSSKGRFDSITVFIEATGIDQLQNLFEDLKKHPATRMVI